MPKRKRTQTIDFDSDASVLLLEDGSGQESDDSFTESPKSKHPSNNGKETRRTRINAPKRTRVAASAIEQQGSVCDTSITMIHPASWHVLKDPDAIRKSLLRWYDKIHKVRGMPWRKTYDPSLDKDGRAQRAYEVWVSEIMLQQTQVVTVIPYYNKWMSKFPTIKDLATSDIETVNSLWKGLGYYSRAARLLSGAQKVVKELDGRLPRNAKDMQAKIPGIGRYSAGAVCSIAYNQCVPVLDGNVIRVMTRFLALYAPPKGKQAQDILWAGAEAFVEGTSRPGDINQALIELGSTVCKVRDPVCSDCALRPWCRAYQRTQSIFSQVDEEANIEELCTLCEPLPAGDPGAGLVTIYPMKVERKKAREELDSVNVIEWRTRDKRRRYFMLVRRPEGGLLAGLHEFPTVPNISGASATAAKVAKIPNDLLTDLLVNPPSPFHPKDWKLQDSCSSSDATDGATRVVDVKPAGDVVHGFSHIKKTYRVQWVVLEGGGDKPPELHNSPMSPTLPTSEKNRKLRKGKPNYSEGSQAEDRSVAMVARWVRLDEVEDANIGTGVMKVWKLVQTLWR
ncbi:DNA glycosylase [Gyrodon lividus]|nr:DNA glycosylase [Gyrodon lividus]